jgi:hypothetical protein
VNPDVRMAIECIETARYIRDLVDRCVRLWEQDDRDEMRWADDGGAA